MQEQNAAKLPKITSNLKSSVKKHQINFSNMQKSPTVMY